jgi:4-alpha-glucanotransferase
MERSWTDQRAMGMGLHISCLPGGQGIGCFDENAYAFIDFLAAAGIKFWQVCPLAPTSYGDSPYQGTSAFALNPYFIDLKALGIDTNPGNSTGDETHQHRVFFGEIYNFFQNLLPEIHKNFPQTEQKKLQHFRENTPWLRPYSLFSALKKHFGGKSWMEWPSAYRQYEKIAAAKLPEPVLIDAKGHEILQYFAQNQWGKLKQYAHENGVKIIGDIPIYPGLDSADVCSEPQNFKLDRLLNPLRIAGVPPDYFTENGQLWGNPVYDWDFLGKNHYDWWQRRIRRNRELFDVLRLDHFRGFDRFWTVSPDAPTAKEGKWEKGPGEALFRCFEGIPFIAEDLGELDESARNLMQKLDFPGMKVLQFAFSNDPKNLYLPHQHHPHSVLYLGTHDNDTLIGWYGGLSDSARDQIRRYFGIGDHEISWKFLTEIYRSPCFLGIICPQDLLELGSEGRFNAPGTSCGNWQWRMTPKQFLELQKMAPQLKSYAALYGR